MLNSIGAESFSNGLIKPAVGADLRQPADVFVPPTYFAAEGVPANGNGGHGRLSRYCGLSRRLGLTSTARVADPAEGQESGAE